ncbi:2-hydroxyacid dehydrogenase [Aliikangiella sp. IMCC44632]
MSIAIVAPTKNAKPWVKALQQLAPSLDIQVWPQINDPAAVRLALVWQHPENALAPLINCKLVVSMGAGVDHLIADKSILSSGVACARLVDDKLASMMAEYLLTLIESHRHHFFYYQKCQQQQQWQPRETLPKSHFKVGIMGLGKIGEGLARALVANGYQVSAWRKNHQNLKSNDGFSIKTFYGNEQANAFFEQTNWLINVLPLTSATKQILSQKVFQRVPMNTVLVNLGRGDHLNETDLIAALASGKISQAYLDVFSQEPLPAEHAFWKHDQVVMTPHVASLTQPESVAPQIIENYRRVKANQEPLNLVCLVREY